MINKVLLSVLFLLAASTIFCQDKTDKIIDWSSNEDCLKTYAGLEIFKVVATPPLLKTSFEDLEQTTEDIVKGLRLNRKHKSIVTLKIFFPIEGKPCINKIELDGDYLSDPDIQKLIAQFDTLVDYESGRQGSNTVICESIFDIIIRKGKFHHLQYTNVEFR